MIYYVMFYLFVSVKLNDTTKPIQIQIFDRLLIIILLKKIDVSKVCSVRVYVIHETLVRFPYLPIIYREQ